MKQGIRIYDTDTHIDPGADALEKYVDPSFRPRLDDLAPYRIAVTSRSNDGSARHTYRFVRQAYERTLGAAEPRSGSGDAREWRAQLRPRPGVVDDRSDNRIFDMDADDRVLMFGSDYPHHESWFPHSVDKVLEWSSLGPQVKRKLFWENATRCFKQT